MTAADNFIKGGPLFPSRSRRGGADAGRARFNPLPNEKHRGGLQSRDGRQQSAAILTTRSTRREMESCFITHK